jgi:bifunctional ADP-heptose synthase (sugar kinase/adenylyltransferase)
VDSAQLLALVGALRGRCVAVIGDVVADEFVYGRVARVSREAPVLILEYDSTEIVPAGRATRPTTWRRWAGPPRSPPWSGVTSRDSGCCARCTSGSIRAAWCARPRVPTPVKTRILAGGIHSAKQQVVRIDRGVANGFDDRARAAFERQAWPRAAARRRAGVRLRLRAGDARARAPPARGHRHRVAGDSDADRHAHRLLDYRGLTACTPNESEVEQALGIRINDNLKVLEKAGRALLERTRMRAVLITRGSRGMALFVKGAPTLHIPIYGSDEIADVTGAGDTVMATMALALAAGATFELAARLANYAGGLVVMKRGTATISAAELTAAVRRG